MHTLGCPSVEDLKPRIKWNSIKGWTVTVDEIILAEKVFEPDVASLKGKRNLIHVLTPFSSINCHSWQKNQENSYIEHVIFVKALKLTDYHVLLSRIVLSCAESGFKTNTCMATMNIDQS